MFSMYAKTIVKHGLWLSTLSFISACGGESTENLITEEQPSTVQLKKHPYDVNTYNWSQITCDPLGGGQQPVSNHGLIAELFYLPSGSKGYDNVGDYIDNGISSPQTLYFSDLYVPTRFFDTGFPTETGGVVQNNDGEDLLQHFALRFKSQLKLSQEGEEGDYELAILADDGARMKFIDEWGEEAWVVDNDGAHPTQFGCGDTVRFQKDTVFDVRLEYFLASSPQITMIPMWRKVDSSTPIEKECGKQGNGRYFDFNKDSSPKKHYLDLLENGWKPIASENWILPPSRILNPCKQGTSVKISNFKVVGGGDAKVTVTWETNIPATSQVIMRDSQNREFLSVSDNFLRTSHSIVIDKSGEYFDIQTYQALSITEDMGRTLSRVLEAEFL